MSGNGVKNERKEEKKGEWREGSLWQEMEAKNVGAFFTEKERALPHPTPVAAYSILIRERRQKKKKKKFVFPLPPSLPMFLLLLSLRIK